jgi:hypothetical protein
MESCRQNQNTHFMLHKLCPENFAVYEIMWKNNVERNRPQMAISLMRIAWRITKVTDTHSECIIITGFPQQKWLHETVFR